MRPKYSPVRCTILTLEQPVPENKKIQRNAFKGGSGVEPAKYPPKVKSENVLTTLECQRGISYAYLFFEGVGAFL